MKRVPLMYRTDEESKDLSLSSRSDKFGNILHCVEYMNNGQKDYAFFKHLSSALDFIQTNFSA